MCVSTSTFITTYKVQFIGIARILQMIDKFGVTNLIKWFEHWTIIEHTYDRIISTYMVRHHWVFAVHFVHACSIFTYETNFLYESYSCVCVRSKSHDVEREKNRSAQRHTSKHTMREVHTSINKLLEPNENRICVQCVTQKNVLALLHEIKFYAVECGSHTETWTKVIVFLRTKRCNFKLHFLHMKKDEKDFKRAQIFLLHRNFWG